MPFVFMCSSCLALLRCTGVRVLAGWSQRHGPLSYILVQSSDLLRLGSVAELRLHVPQNSDGAGCGSAEPRGVASCAHTS